MACSITHIGLVLSLRTEPKEHTDWIGRRVVYVLHTPDTTSKELDWTNITS